MKTISVLEGKNKFSQVVASAAKGEPQVITKNGTPTAVVISYEEFKGMSARNVPLIDALRNNPASKHGMTIDLTRDKDAGRQAAIFADEN